jgi:hypothetical protein
MLKPKQNLLEQLKCIKKNEGQEGKTGPVQGWVPVGRVKVNGEGEEGQIW